jgi:hypothetical protein
MKLYLNIDLKVSGDEFTIDIEPKVCSTDRPVINFVDDEYIPSKGDKYYFLPGVNIPRVKLKDLALQYGVKSVRNIEDATHIFGGNGSINKMTTTSWENFNNTNKFLEFIDIIKDHVDEYYLEKVNQAFEHYTLDKIIISNSVYSSLKYNLDPSHPLIDEIQGSTFVTNMRNNSCYAYTEDPEHVGLLEELIGKDVYNEDSVLVYVNGPDAATIDAVMYEQIADMFRSSDSDNHVLAMEIMANCRYKESLLYLEFLFKEYSYQMSQSHTKNHVNFKSLLSYLNKDKAYMSTDIDNIMKCLIDKGVLDTDKVNIIMEKYSDQIEDRGESTFFKVKTVTLQKETLALLNSNYTYIIQEDFVPVIPDTLGVAEVANEVEILDEDIETAITIIEREELKSELIAIEETNPVSESELNKPEEESNNHQIKEKNDTDDFEWF